MMRRRSQITMALVILLLAAVLSPLVFAMGKGQEVPRMTKEELRSHLADPNFVIIDVRVGGEWRGSREKIQGAIREEPDQVKTWADRLPKDKTLVLYCS